MIVLANKKPLTLFGRIISQGCLFYTVITLLLYTGGMIVSSIEREWIPTISMMYMVLVFSLFLAAANVLVLGAKIPAVLKLILHYAAATVVFYVIFILWGGFQRSGSSVLVILLVYTFIYCICALVVFSFRYIKGNRENSRTDYETQFRMKN